MTPHDLDALLGRATARLAAGPDPAVRQLLETAARSFPDHAGLACRLADALHLEGKLAEAAAGYRRALALDERLLDAWYGLGAALLRAGAYGSAAEALRQAVALHPKADGARANLAEALYQLGEVDPALAEFRAVQATVGPELRAKALTNIACTIPGSPAATNTDILAARQRWADVIAANIRPLAPVPRPPSPKLRVGYVSSFFGAANWMKPVFGVMNHHDRARFEVHLISLGPLPTAEAGYRDYPDDVVWPAAALDNGALARRIAAAGIDVLVDLNGYSAQPRLGLFLYRPAPVQIGWFNMYATTGLPVYDCLVGDAAVIPAEEEAFYIERIERVPGSYLAFEVLYPVPDVTPPPCLDNGFLTFGCLGSAYKITGEVIAAWARILHGSPGSQLLLKNSTLGDDSNRSALLGRFARAGIGAERLILDGRSEHFDFLKAYGRIDVALDTFPYNGGTTTTEALWQGVPVLTFGGDRWASRTSRSLLLAGGLPDWVAADEPAYVRQAVALANDAGTPAYLAALRASLRDRLRASPACDSAGLCRALEDLYLRLSPRPKRGDSP
ncbi:MAG: tetratricopeptide repeat protein [Gemmataceae bacterium]